MVRSQSQYRDDRAVIHPQVAYWIEFGLELDDSVEVSGQSDITLRDLRADIRKIGLFGELTTGAVG